LSGLAVSRCAARSTQPAIRGVYATWGTLPPPGIGVYTLGPGSTNTLR
jgi:hypothetical protein